jgi:hypothetical protein
MTDFDKSGVEEGEKSEGMMTKVGVGFGKGRSS